VLSRSLPLGLCISLVAVSPALATGGAPVAGISAGTTLIGFVGVLLVGIGAYSLARSGDSSKSPNAQESATGAESESAPTVRERTSDPFMSSKHAAEEESGQGFSNRGAEITVAEGSQAGEAAPTLTRQSDGDADSPDMKRLLDLAAPVEDTLRDRDEIAAEMLEALRAERARRGH
jgi:hypothetical protein